jgi:hypothetical protein
MTSLGSPPGIKPNTNFKAEPKKPEKKEKKKDREGDMKALGDNQIKHALDVFSSRFSNVLGEGYTEEKVPKSKDPKNGPDNPNSQKVHSWDFGKAPGMIENLENGSYDHIRVTNEPDDKTHKRTKNSRTIIKAEHKDTIVLGGKGWKKTKNVTDLESWKKDPKHPNTGTLYEDNYGNKVLIVGEGNDDSVIVNGKFDRPPKKAK